MNLRRLFEAAGERPSERQRVPPPLIRTRISPGAGAMLQPNVTGDGEARLTRWFWLAVLITGVATGLLGTGAMFLLFTVQRIAFGAQEDGSGFQAAVERADAWHRLTPLLIGGAFAGVAWYLLRRLTPGQTSDADEVLWVGGRLAVPRSVGTAIISEIVIGLGASLGREAAPKLLGALSGSVVAGRMRLSPAQLRLLIACGGGAGLGAVYNVPLGGALFAAEVLVGSLNLPVVLPALACSGVATLTSWIYLGRGPTYLNVPEYAIDARVIVWALVAGPLIGALAAAYVRLIGWVSHRRVSGALLVVAPLIAFAILGVVALRYPQLYGNGKGMARDAFQGLDGLWLLGALAVLKPLVTALCLGSGASGGLFTPVMSTGAVLGGFLGAVWGEFWPGTALGAYALVGAAAMIGAAMQAPLAALALVLELTHSGFGLMVAMVLATALSTAVSRWIDGYSIYSARLTGETT